MHRVQKEVPQRMPTDRWQSFYICQIPMEVQNLLAEKSTNALYFYKFLIRKTSVIT